jgi:hypothetical protein
MGLMLPQFIASGEESAVLFNEHLSGLVAKKAMWDHIGRNTQDKIFPSLLAHLISAQKESYEPGPVIGTVFLDSIVALQQEQHLPTSNTLIIPNKLYAVMFANGHFPGNYRLVRPGGNDLLGTSIWNLNFIKTMDGQIIVSPSGFPDEDRNIDPISLVRRNGTTERIPEYASGVKQGQRFGLHVFGNPSGGVPHDGDRFTYATSIVNPITGLQENIAWDVVVPTLP